MLWKERQRLFPTYLVSPSSVCAGSCAELWGRHSGQDVASSLGGEAPMGVGSCAEMGGWREMVGLDQPSQTPMSACTKQVL